VGIPDVTAEGAEILLYWYASERKEKTKEEQKGEKSGNESISPLG
jgi:hypothetical protein